MGWSIRVYGTLDLVLAARPRRRKFNHLAMLARRQPLGTVALAIIIALVVVAVSAPLLSPYSPVEYFPGQQLNAPSSAHWLGTDEIGRDVLSRAIWGSRASLLVGAVAVVIGVGGGGLVGLLSGYLGGWVGLIVERVVDGIMAFPALLLSIAVVAALGPGLTNAMLAIGVVILPRSSRVIRGEVLRIKESTYVEAAVSVGAGPIWIMVRHILPNIMAPLIVLASITLGGAIITESSLAFLGLGVQPPTPTWGSMIGGSSRLLLISAPWLLWVPAVAIGVVVLAVNLLGDAVRDVLDPRLRGLS